MKNKRATVDFYRDREVVENYEWLRYGDEVGKYIHEKEVRVLLEELTPLEKRRVMDIAAGTGRLTIELARRGASVLGLDTSKSMLRLLKSKVKSECNPLDVDVIMGDAEHLPFKEKVFDISLSAYTINHIPNYKSALSEICKATSGRVIVISPYLISALIVIPVVINPLRNLLKRLSMYNKYFWPNEIANALENEGLNVRQRGLHLVLPKVVPFTLPYRLVKILEKISLVTERLLKKVYTVQITIGTHDPNRPSYT